MKASPHPGPLPQEEGEVSTADQRASRDAGPGISQHASSSLISTGLQPGVESRNGYEAVSTALRGKQEAAKATGSLFTEPDRNDWLLWQLADSAFPTGGFAHSAGLESAWQHGEIHNRDELRAFAEASLQQLGHAALPFVIAAYNKPERLEEFDQHCDAFTTNHVANRASRSQGRALLSAVERIFQGRCPQPASTPLLHVTPKRPEGRALHSAHFSPVFGALMSELGIPRETTLRLFFFNHLRGLLAAAVRLNIVGPMEAQAMQHRLGPRAEEILHRCETLTVDDVAQTSPLLDLWQGAQDRLYSRLFQS